MYSPKFFLVLVFLYALTHGTFAQAMLPVFEAETIDDDIQIGYGLAIGDVNNDGKKDILLADKKEFVWYRNPDWKRFVLVKDLTEKDNVCLAARDMNADGVVELAVGAQWNPGETSNFSESGSVHYVSKPQDTKDLWSALELPHLPTIHRMRWVRAGRDNFNLVVLPLHGVDNVRGDGDPVKVMAFGYDPSNENWSYQVIDEAQHMTHNFELVESCCPWKTELYIGGKEGIRKLTYLDEWSEGEWIVKDRGFGELRMGKLNLDGEPLDFLAGIEPIHGNILSIHTLGEKGANRHVLTEDLKQGHALACADLLEQGETQIVAGWRSPNEAGKVGVRMYIHKGDGTWDMHVIDDNEMACEDLKVADFNNDLKPDIIAAGRSTNNLKIYWNKSR